MFKEVRELVFAEMCVDVLKVSNGRRSQMVDHQI